RRGRAAPGRRPAAAGAARVVLQLLLEPADLLLGLAQVLLQSGPAVERGGASAGADAQAVLGHAGEIDQGLLAQHGPGVRQEPVEEIDVSGTEVGQGVVVDGDAARDPAEGVVVDAQPGQGAGRADALQGSVQPQGDEDARVGGRRPGVPFDGADAVVQGGEVQAPDEVPDEACLVVGVQEILQGQGGEDLLAISAAQAG